MKFDMSNVTDIITSINETQKIIDDADRSIENELSDIVDIVLITEPKIKLKQFVVKFKDSLEKPLLHRLGRLFLKETTEDTGGDYPLDVATNYVNCILEGIELYGS
jgi:hypothetical protein